VPVFTAIITPVVIAVMFFMTVSVTVAVAMVVVVITIGESGREANTQHQGRTRQIKPFLGHNRSFAR
jgi:hypothetical protein